LGKTMTRSAFANTSYEVDGWHENGFAAVQSYRVRAWAAPDGALPKNFFHDALLPAMFHPTFHAFTHLEQWLILQVGVEDGFHCQPWIPELAIAWTLRLDQDRVIAVV